MRLLSALELLVLCGVLYSPHRGCSRVALVELWWSDHSLTHFCPMGLSSPSLLVRIKGEQKNNTEGATAIVNILHRKIVVRFSVGSFAAPPPHRHSHRYHRPAFFTAALNSKLPSSPRLCVCASQAKPRSQSSHMCACARALVLLAPAVAAPPAG